MTTDNVLDQWFAEAEQHFYDGREGVAVEILARYVGVRQAHARAWMLLGDGLRILGRSKEAEAALLRAEALAPEEKRFLAQCRLGVLYSDWGKFADAEDWFAKATASPSGAKAGYLWILRGAALARSERMDEAEACHRRAVHLDAVDRDEALLNLGYVLRAQRRYAEAESAFDQAAALDPSSPETREAAASLRGMADVLDRLTDLAVSDHASALPPNENPTRRTSPPRTRREFAWFQATGEGSPDILTATLGQPSQSWAAGDPGPAGPRRFMCWKLESGLDDTAPLEQHIEMLLAALEPKAAALLTLAANHSLTLQCVGYYPTAGHGPRFDRDVLRRVANLGLALDLDFYC